MRVGDHGYHRDFPTHRGVIVWVLHGWVKLKYFTRPENSLNDTITVSQGFIVIDVPFEEKVK